MVAEAAKDIEVFKASSCYWLVLCMQMEGTCLTIDDIIEGVQVRNSVASSSRCLSMSFPHSCHTSFL
jgi:hypothetical protein